MLTMLNILMTRCNIIVLLMNTLIVCVITGKTDVYWLLKHLVISWSADQLASPFVAQSSAKCLAKLKKPWPQQHGWLEKYESKRPKLTKWRYWKSTFTECTLYLHVEPLQDGCMEILDIYISRWVRIAVNTSARSRAMAPSSRSRCFERPYTTLYPWRLRWNWMVSCLGCLMSQRANAIILF